MALNFDGTSQYVDMGNPTTLRITEGTWMCWFLIEPSPSWEKILSKRYVNSSSTTWGYWAYMNNTGYYEVGVGNNSSSYGYYKIGSVALDDGAVHHLAATFSNSDGLRAYIDGVEASGSIVGSKPSTIGTNGESFYIASAVENSVRSYGKGKRWDVRVYNRVLTANEIAEIYHKRGADKIWQGLVGWWRLDEFYNYASFLDTMDSTSEWLYWGAFTAIATDSTTKYEGAASIKPTKGTSEAGGTISRNITAVDLTNKYVGIFMYIKDQTTLDKFQSTSCITLNLEQTSVWAKYYSTTFDKSDLKVGEWFRLERSINDFSPIGSPPNKTIIKILIGCTTNNTTDTFAAGDIFWDAFYYANAPNSFINITSAVSDLSGNGNHGTPYNGPTYQDSPHRLRRGFKIL